MPSKAPAAIKPTTMRIPPDLLKRADKAAKRADRSRSYMINLWIAEGLKKAEKAVPTGALD